MKIRLLLLIAAAAIFPMSASLPVSVNNQLPRPHLTVAEQRQESGSEENYIEAEAEGDFVQWVDFNTSVHAMMRALDVCRAMPLGLGYGYADVLAFITLKNGNSFGKAADAKQFGYLEAELKAGRDPFLKYAENKYFLRYKESYHAAMDGLVGEYTDADGNECWGVRGYCPIAAGYYYNDYDDFGNSRSFGYKRRHLGHDMMGSVGTPIVAAEGGVIQELGWNRYGGWRVGVRSFDGKRYYYYAHLRRGRPFAAGLKLGDHVRPGQVIGYLGKTGYSSTEDKNMTTSDPHLHFGLQLIFDESQEDGNGEIWIDVYPLTRFLAQSRRAKVVKDETGEYTSTGLISVIY